MSYCINRKCKHRKNKDEQEYCANCGTPLLINNRYRLIQPLRSLELEHHTEVWQVDDGRNWKFMKILETDLPKSVAFLEREARILKSLNNPGIPKVEDDSFFTITLGITQSEQLIGDFNRHSKDNLVSLQTNIPDCSKRELYCLVMEYIEGENLEDFVERNGKISQYQALNWLKQLLDIFKYIHENFYFHRDIKPSNIILKPNGKLALIDFGSARIIKESYYLELDKKLFFKKVGINQPSSSKITKIISEGYTAPEQVEGAALPQSDFYALGRTLVHLVTGKHPIYFYSPNINKLIWRQEAKQITKPLADLIDDLMQPEAAARPQNPGAIASRLTKSSLFWREWLSIKGLIVLIVSLILLPVFGIKVVNAIGHNYYKLGRESLVADNLPLARKYLERAIKLNPNQPEIHNDLGLVCKKQSDLICAISQYEKAIKLDSDRDVNSTTTYFNLANLYEDIGNRNAVDKASKLYLIASSGLAADEINNPITSLNASNNYGRLQILYNKNNLLALEILQRPLAQIEKLLNQSEIIERRSELLALKSKLLKNIGWAYLQEGELEKAKEFLEEAKQLDNEKRPELYCLLAQVEQHLEPQKSLDFWKKCREYGNEQNLPEVVTWQIYATQYLKNKE